MQSPLMHHPALIYVFGFLRKQSEKDGPRNQQDKCGEPSVGGSTDVGGVVNNQQDTCGNVTLGGSTGVRNERRNGKTGAEQSLCGVPRRRAYSQESNEGSDIVLQKSCAKRKQIVIVDSDSEPEHDSSVTAKRAKLGTSARSIQVDQTQDEERPQPSPGRVYKQRKPKKKNSTVTQNTNKTISGTLLPSTSVAQNKHEPPGGKKNNQEVHIGLKVVSAEKVETRRISDTRRRASRNSREAMDEEDIRCTGKSSSSSVSVSILRQKSQMNARVAQERQMCDRNMEEVHDGKGKDVVLISSDR